MTSILEFRRGWGTYRSLYLFVKLSALLLVAIVNPDNCLFRTVRRDVVSITQQALLVLMMFAFLLLQCFFSPFIDTWSNASEWVSRLNYVLTALVGLAVAVQIPYYLVLDGPVLYVYASLFFHDKMLSEVHHRIYALTYGMEGCLCCYFIIKWHRC